jgi:hypothetical protein
MMYYLATASEPNTITPWTGTTASFQIGCWLLFIWSYYSLQLSGYHVLGPVKIKRYTVSSMEVTPDMQTRESTTTRAAKDVMFGSVRIMYHPKNHQLKIVSDCWNSVEGF